jgi:rubredoxin
MSIRIHALRKRSGEIIQIRETPDGTFVCPVCGFIGEEEPPWWWCQSRQDRNQPWSEEFVAASFNTCSCCGTQFGDTDYTDSDEKDAQKKKWEELRDKWLDKMGRSESSLKQLKNLGLDLPE